MKKIFTFSLVSILCLGLVGCGINSSNDDKKDKKEVKETEQKEVVKEETPEAMTSKDVSYIIRGEKGYNQNFKINAEGKVVYTDSINNKTMTFTTIEGKAKDVLLTRNPQVAEYTVYVLTIDSKVYRITRYAWEEMVDNFEFIISDVKGLRIVTNNLGFESVVYYDSTNTPKNLKYDEEANTYSFGDKFVEEANKPTKFYGATTTEVTYNKGKYNYSYKINTEGNIVFTNNNTKETRIVDSIPEKAKYIVLVETSGKDYPTYQVAVITDDGHVYIQEYDVEFPKASSFSLLSTYQLQFVDGIEIVEYDGSKKIVVIWVTDTETEKHITKSLVKMDESYVYRLSEVVE